MHDPDQLSPEFEAPESSQTLPEPTLMLDVHPAHHAASTWRDFFVHIATIVLGLIIAVGLEQTVEFFHHRHQVAETREALRREHDLNVRLFAIKTEEFRRFTPILQTNLAIFLYLQKHPGAPEKDLPGKLHWFNITVPHIDAAWRTAQQDNVLALMPPAEVQLDAELYRRLQIISDAADATRISLYEARSFTINDPDPSHLTPAAIDRQVDLANKVLLNHVLEGSSQIVLAVGFPEFSSPSPDDLTQITHVSPDQDADAKRSELIQKMSQIRFEGQATPP